LGEVSFAVLTSPEERSGRTSADMEAAHIANAVGRNSFIAGDKRPRPRQRV
jgi:hypothetical protein